MTAPIGPGIHDLSLAEYVADPCPQPSLSASIAQVLLALSPRHAFERHPRLNPGYVHQRGNHLDLGTVAHRLLLGKGEEIAVIDCAEYRKDADKQQRDDAYAAGKTPIKAPDYEIVCAMAEAARAQLAAHEIGDPMGNPLGAAEQTVVWSAPGGIWCRACIDWLILDEAEPILFNYKTTTCAHPDVWLKRAYQLGYDLAAAFHGRGIRTLYPDAAPPQHIWIVQERKPPYALSVLELGPGSLAMAERKVDQAIDLWRRCLHAGVWPAYPPKLMTIDAPPYAEAEWTQREVAGHYEIYEQLIEGLAP